MSEVVIKIMGDAVMHENDKEIVKWSLEELYATMLPLIVSVMRCPHCDTKLVGKPATKAAIRRRSLQTAGKDL